MGYRVNGYRRDYTERVFVSLTRTGVRVKGIQTFVPRTGVCLLERTGVR